MTRFAHAFTFEDFIDSTKRAATQDELFGILQSTLLNYGYDRVIFSIVRDIDLGPEYSQHGVLQNYPMEWHDYYMASGYREIDPVHAYVAQTSDVFAWDTLEEKLGGLTAKQKLCLSEAAEAGIRNGICAPTANTLAKLSGIAVATTEEKDAAHIDHDLLDAYARQFYKCFKRLALKDAPLPVRNITLSSREQQILRWLALGKTDEEIGGILSINIGTVRFHTQSLFKKLEVHNRPYAVLKAIRLGLLDPQISL
ncbi:MAG: hypothetical protein DI586_05395 [Micavibrio aeruginosavorus]|uniref:HTH luxR-type domain-containing protein n=1 Tax=Micavibrio aeruginosavorus TaxID=349221 RepID=A0A2W5HCM6_9BACT|nr:MAG: hypothetical protein DI586_05395 [Micavibrio aeruginosavorus]